MTDMLKQGSSSALGVGLLIEEVCHSIKRTIRVKEDIHLPIEAKFYNRSLEKEKISLLFYDFCGEILRLWYWEQDKEKLASLIEKELGNLTIREHGSMSFISSLANCLTRLQIKIEYCIRHEGRVGHRRRIKHTERVGLLTLEKDRRAYRRLVSLARAFQELILYEKMAQAVLNYQNAVGPSVLLDLLSNRISREWAASFAERYRIGTQVALGADYLMTDLVEFPEVYLVLAAWCRKISISVEDVERLKNHLVRTQTDLGIELCQDYLNILAREKLEQMSYYIVIPFISN